MWTIVWLLINVIWNTVDARHINKLIKVKEDQEFETLEKRQQIRGELEIGGRRFESLGCWRDAWSRSLPTLEGEHYLLMDPNYKGRRHALFKCARAALDKGYNLFGIENGGQCFASADGEKGYHKYGVSKECKVDGKGGPWSLQVYRFLNKHDAINGAYSQWSAWGSCSKSCAGGVRRRMRNCSNPSPLNGGRDCKSLGSSVESQDCNVRSCKIKFGVGKPESQDLPLVSTKRDESHLQPPATNVQPIPPSTNSQPLDLPVNTEQHFSQSNSKVHFNNKKGKYESFSDINNQEMGQRAGEQQQSSLHDNGDQFKLQQAKYMPMSNENASPFKQAAIFQNSMTASNAEQASRLAESPKPFIETGHDHSLPSGNSDKLHNSKQSNDDDMHSTSTAYKKPVQGNDKDEPSASPMQMSSSEETLTNEKAPNEDHFPHNEENEQGDQRPIGGFVGGTVMSIPSDKFHDHSSNKMADDEQHKSPQRFSKVGQSLVASNPRVQEKIPTDDQGQNSNKLKSGLDDVRNVEMQATPNGEDVQEHIKNAGHDFGNPSQEIGDQAKQSKESPLPSLETPAQGSSHGDRNGNENSQPQEVQDQETQSKESPKQNFKAQGSIHGDRNRDEKASDVSQSSKAVKGLQQTLPGKQPSTSGKGEESSSQHYNKEESENNQKSQPKIDQDEEQKTGKAFSAKIQAQGSTSQKVDNVDDSQHFTDKGEALSIDKGEPVGKQSPEQTHTSSNKEQDGESMSPEEHPPKVLDSNKLSSSNEKPSSQDLPESNTNEKQATDEGQSPQEEGEPVPIVDLNKAGAVNGADYGPTPNGEFSGPGNGMQNPSQSPGPVFDNEAIQGISDMSQRADQTVFQQENPGGQAGPDENTGVGYDDMSAPQAYIGEIVGETTKQQKQDAVTIKQRYRDQDQNQAAQTSNYYNTEPAEDCLCPKKECSAKADIAFLVDGSANIPQPYYARVLEFIKIFSRGFDKRNIHVGMMTYGDDTKTALDLKALSDFNQLDDAVSIAPYVGGKAHTGNALSKLKTGLFAVSGRQDAPRALILLSSGGSVDDVVAPGAELRDSGVKVTTIGLGKQANVRELITVASEPKSEHVFTAFLDTLPNAMDEIIQGVCRDVMGIVRDRQEPCTCETLIAQGGPSPSYDYTKGSAEKENEPEEEKIQQIQGPSYPKYQEETESMKVPPHRNMINQSSQYSSIDQRGNSSNMLTIVEEGLSSARPGSDDHPPTDNLRLQVNDNTLKPAIGNGLHMPGADYSKEKQRDGHGDDLETSHEYRGPKERQFSNQSPQIPASDELSVGAHYNLTPELNKSRNEPLQNDSSNSEQNHMDGSEIHRFSAGFPEHFEPRVNDGTAKLTNQEVYNEQPRADQKPNDKQGNAFPLSFATNQAHVQGTGLLVNPAFRIPPTENVHGRPLVQQRKPTVSFRQGDLTSPYRRPTKVIAVGKPAAEYVNTDLQKQNRQECSKVNLGVVLDSTATIDGQDQQQATMMMNLAKKVSHLFSTSPAGNSVGMVVYSGSPQPSVVHFDKFLDQKSMDEAIDNASKPSVEIKIGKALTMAQKELFSQLPTSKRNILLLVTDGASFDDVGRPALELKRRGIEVFCLGVGKDVNTAQLDLIASDPKESHVFLAPFNDADKLMERIQKEICLAANREPRFSTQRKCPSDLGFVIDGSRSVEVLGKGNFKKMLDFVKNVSLGFHISPEDTRVGAITYGTEPHLVIPFNKYTTPASLAFAIENMSYPGTSTMTGRALELASQTLFDSGSRINVPKVLVVLSKGASRDSVQKSAQALHKAGVTVISVGLGPSYDMTELNNIASMPVAYNVLKTKFNELQNKVNELQDKICQANNKEKILI